MLAPHGSPWTLNVNEKILPPPPPPPPAQLPHNSCDAEAIALQPEGRAGLAFSPPPSAVRGLEAGRQQGGVSAARRPTTWRLYNERTIEAAAYDDSPAGWPALNCPAGRAQPPVRPSSRAPYHPLQHTLHPIPPLLQSSPKS